MKKLIALFVFSLSIFSGFAQDLEKGLLWKISGKDLQSPSYIYGTMHATCDATLKPNVLKALEDTKQNYLELDMDSPTMAAEMMQGMAMKNGTKISTLISDEDFKKLDAFLKENTGLSAKLMDTYKPMIIQSLLLPKQLDCPMQSYELEIVKEAKLQNEEIYGLETVQEQLAIFDKIPYKDQVDELLKVAQDGMESSKADLKKLIEIYESEDLNVIYKYTQDEMGTATKDYSDILLKTRNKNWIPKIEENIKKAATFFGVGAAHLAGPDGVINLLRQQGYTVEAVK